MTKIKISHTIDQGLLNWINAGIKDKKFASYSHAIEYCISRTIKAETTKVESKGKKQSIEEGQNDGFDNVSIGDK